MDELPLDLARFTYMPYSPSGSNK